MLLNFKKVMVLAFLASANICIAQSLQEKAKTKITALQKLINTAEKAKLDASNEKATLRTAEIFIKYANWDEAHKAENEKYFALAKPYKAKAKQLAEDLPDFERTEVNLMLDEAIANINNLITGKIKRKPTTKIDWTKLAIKGNQIVFNGKPVFLADYTWKPKDPQLQEFYGQLDGYLLTPSQVVDEKGTLSPKVLSELKAKPAGKFGSIFMNHKNPPKWALAKDPNFTVGERNYTAYDIDNPLARTIQANLLKGTVPLMARKNYSALGYLLTNEPHWFTAKGVWATGEVSEFTKAKFRDWLKTKHQNIAVLNKLWASNFTSFDDVKITIPIDKNLQGQPIWYDWVTFNSVRVTEWFNFLKTNINKYDADAKVHIKVIPKHWTENARDHGLDMEDLVELSGVIGNDAGAEQSLMWGKEDWQDKYVFHWRELAMSYDFFKSVSPDKINYNSEAHFLSTVKFRDLYLKPDYARAVYWMAYTSGMNAAQTWYWCRNADGSVQSKVDKGYPGSVMQQPRILSEVTTTVMDLNRYSEEIAAFQNVKKPIRIFYSKTSAINKKEHMDDVFSIYEGLSFDGVPLGFVTPKIIATQNNKDWGTILVSQTPFVTINEFNALQKYLNNGGTLIMDSESLTKDQYGKPLNQTLKAGKGKLMMANSLADMKAKAYEVLATQNLLPELNITETNSSGRKTCIWKTIKTKDGKIILSLINVGLNDASLKLALKGASNGVVCTDLLTGTTVSSEPVLKPNQVYFVSIAKK